jgi:hypothetical protein
MQEIIGVEHSISLKNSKQTLDEVFLAIDNAAKSGKPVKIGIEGIKSEEKPGKEITFFGIVRDYARTYPNVELIPIDSKLGRDITGEAKQAQIEYLGKQKKFSRKEKANLGKKLLVATKYRSKTMANRIKKQNITLSIVGGLHARDIETMLNIKTKYLGHAGNRNYKMMLGPIYGSFKKALRKKRLHFRKR